MGAQDWQNDDPNLKDFIRLGAHTYLRESSNHETQQLSSAPDLIVVCTWMGAPTRPIAKYVAGHTILFPDSPILLLRSALEDFMVRTRSAQIDRIQPAAAVLKQHVEEIRLNKREPKVLFHVFSNGGTWSACMLKEAYARLTTDKLPVSALVVDSAPSLPRARLGYNAMMQCVPRPWYVRALATFVIWAVIAIAYVMEKLRLKQSIILTLRAVLNDPNGPFLTPNAPRTYICSKRDDMIPLEDVILHASEARMAMESSGVREGQQNITIEEFVGSKHVGHMMVDSVRYWRVIEETWVKVL